MAILPTLRFGYVGPSVKILQMNLNGLNYNFNGLQINGIFDLLTDEIVTDFQFENKLIIDGIVGPVTWKVLLGKIIEIQKKLNSLGFNSGVPDGLFGPKTINAVARFQSVNGLNAAGVINPRTREKLFNPNPTDDYRTRPTSQSLNSLHPYVASLANNLLELCNTNSIDVVIIAAFRSWDEQDAVYAQGRTKPGDIVTDAQGGDSYHNWGLAFDCAPVENDMVAWENTDKFLAMGVLGQQAGLEWGGNWTSYAINIVDMPHFQYTFGLSTEELLDGKRPPIVIQ